MATFVVIGWGSLLWDLDDLAPTVIGEWHLGLGPRLPLEFVRISPKRKHSLVVVLDQTYGAKCASSYIHSRKDSIHEVIADLAARERTDLHFIGATSRDHLVQAKQPSIAQSIQHWLQGTTYAGAVWTDLVANFEEDTRSGFSIDAAIAYLQTLNTESLLEAKRYIDFAPQQVVTPLRTALNRDAWWQSLPLK